MENRAHAFAVGLVALLLVGGVLLTLWWFGGGGEEYRIFELETRKGVTGLTNQAAVRFRGVRVGRVMEIDLDDDDPYKVVVVIRVRKDVPITHGTFASLGFQGLTGNAFILLDDNGSGLTLLWFNQPYLEKTFKALAATRKPIVAYGQAKRSGWTIEIQAPEWEELGEDWGLRKGD